MRTSVLLAISIAGFAFALWLARGGDAPSPASVAGKTVPTVTATATATSASNPPWQHTAASSAQAPTPASVRKLDPRGDRFRNRVDEQIPQRLYNVASRCYKGGLERDQRLDLTYRIRVQNGAVTISDVKTTESTINDAQLERCIKDKIAAQTWRDDELPDMEEEDDLYMRAAGWQSYLANAEDNGGDSVN